ncbi:conserved hypothetical protein [Paraburkholderia piptadeniae]|uniref:DUF3331 domain-containing protein n=2 Tax=Paraburkholderia TaxID=1822464 RepID=A0A7X1NEK7_9BURK|nr:MULTISPECIES: DUF3331 domain-containing protein [Paraburkholderia]MPW20449.1 DUF3331 domain-containing protein [Paraburkholderia franconis]SIT50901.1 conserved hypothetical protein [Paraburkholderia piptadeniae]
MTALSKDNIVILTLLNVLDPSADQLNACAKKQWVALKKRRTGPCQAVTGDHRRLSKRPSNIVVVDRLSTCTISVSWSDPCVGRYTEQIWRSGRANVAAICVLTGRAINRGDRVFRPRSHEWRVPTNCHQMILAATIGDCSDLTTAGA